MEVALLRKVLLAYGFSSELIDAHYYKALRDCRDGCMEVKEIIRVTLSNGSRVVLKCLNASPEIETTAHFSELLRIGGVRTPQTFRRQEGFCMPITECGVPLNVLALAYAGDDTPPITPTLMLESGKLLALMHNVALGSSIRFNRPPRFGFTRNVLQMESRFMPFSSISDSTRWRQHEALFKIFHEHVSLLNAIAVCLPRGAVQGDFGFHNFYGTDKEPGIFDYNLAGDECLAGDMLFEGVCLVFRHWQSYPDQCGFICWEHFAEGYMSARRLSDREKDFLGIGHRVLLAALLANHLSLNHICEDRDPTVEIGYVTAILKGTREPWQLIRQLIRCGF
jgi:Ser/Thr protein kinase RdoA (MazF antagonist)